MSPCCHVVSSAVRSCLSGVLLSSGVDILRSLDALDSVVPKQVVLRACNPSFRSVRLKALEEVGVIVSPTSSQSEIHERSALFVALLVNVGRQMVRVYKRCGNPTPHPYR